MKETDNSSGHGLALTKLILKKTHMFTCDATGASCFVTTTITFFFSFLLHLSQLTLYDIVFFGYHLSGGVYLCLAGVQAGKNRSVRSKTTVWSKGFFPLIAGA